MDLSRNDNRNYHYASTSNVQRPEYNLIKNEIVSGASVLDLGCGDGSLLNLLVQEKKVQGMGIELSSSGVNSTKAKGLSALQGPIDQNLPQFTNKQFDIAICNVTLQMVMYPEKLLQEMARISCTQIISFPNFAFFKNRLDLLFRGRMPQPQLFGYTWYNTGHIHQLSCKDFENLCKELKITVIKRTFVETPKSKLSLFLKTYFPNLFANTVLYVTKS